MLNKVHAVCRGSIFAISALLLASCSTSQGLVPSPNIYTELGSYPEADIPDQLKTTTPRILYITDRQISTSKNGRFSYGVKRSSSMAFGEVTVSFGHGLSWQALKKASFSRKRKTPVKMEVTNTRELLRFPATPIPFGVHNGNVVETSRSQLNYNNKIKQFQRLLTSHLASANRREIVLFVHGYNNEFDEAALSLANIWHFTGRVGVPIFYTWPAGNGGLTGYFKDRESGDFSIFHFKETIRMMASTPGLERIHIIAHSRGADIVTTALRELVIADRAAGLNPRKSLKIQNLVLAAPDLDFGVVRQRLIAERFGPAIGQITVYMNQNDGALSLAQQLLAGKRFGRITANDLGQSEKKIFARVTNVHFVDVEDVSGFSGHAYFRENPGVLSDIAIIVRSALPPGDKGRPLTNVSGNFWLLENDYPFAR